MFEGLQNITLFPTTGPQIIANVTVALICGFFISWLYRHTYRGPGYSPTFVNSLVLLSMITSVVIMVVGNNLARAFGLVGAMSIIRFRTAIKNTMDIVYVFFALAIGMAAGVGLYKVAITGTLFIGLVLYIVTKSKISTPEREEYLLQFYTEPAGAEMPAYQGIFDKYCRRYKIINVKSTGEGNLLELSYYVKLKDREKNQDFVKDLRQISGIQYVNLFFDEDQF